MQIVYKTVLRFLDKNFFYENFTMSLLEHVIKYLEKYNQINKRYLATHMPEGVARTFGIGRRIEAAWEQKLQPIQTQHAFKHGVKGCKAEACPKFFPSYQEVRS